jgi:hypothetical protein
MDGASPGNAGAISRKKKDQRIVDLFFNDRELNSTPGV